MNYKKLLKDDAIANVVGNGAIAGSGGPGGEPGVYPKLKKISPVMSGILKRKLPQR